MQQPAPMASAARDKLREVLRNSRAFGALASGIVDDLAAVLDLEEVAGGQHVLSEGEVADSMLVVVSGRLRVSRRNPDGSLNLYNEICPGETVGETGMVLGEVRYADVTAVRDSLVARLRREAFEVLLCRYPVELNRFFAQAVYQKLRHVPQVAEQARAHTIAVIALRDASLVSRLSGELAAALGDFGPAAEFAAGAIDGRQLDQLEQQFEFLVLSADTADSSRMRRLFRQADQIVLVADSREPPELSAIEAELSQEHGFVMKRKHLALVHPAAADRPGDLQAWRTARDVERIYPLRNGDAGDTARLARFLASRAVGVVLGGGGARGFSHLGVLRAFEECGIPVDLIGGNSMGALIGAQYACGMALDEILANTRRFAMGGERPTLPLISLLSGKRLERDLRRMFGDTRIEQLWRPFFASACNLSQACTTVQDSGPLWRAVLASNSPAGLLPPVVWNGDLLVDGAILDNVPVAAMRGRLGTPLERRRGNGTIIAVDVDLREQLCVDPETARLSVWHNLRGYLGGQGGQAPSIAAILYRAGHVGGMHERSRTMAMADYCLEPPVGAFPLMAYRRAAEIAEVGYCHAMEQIARWPARPGRS